MRNTTGFRQGFGVKSAAAGLVLFLAVGLAALSAGSEEREKSLHLELYGGLNALPPSDLNLMVEADTTVQNILFDRYYAYYYQGYSWISEGTGGLKPLRRVFQGGLRVVWPFHSRWALTLGFEGAARTQSSSASFLYGYDVPSYGYSMRDSKEFSDYRVGASGWSALVGIRYEAPLGRRMMIGGYLAGGVSRLECRLSKEWRWHYDKTYSSEPRWVFEQEGGWNMEGAGWGMAFDAGLRLGWRLLPRWTVFLESGYSFRRSGSVSGTLKEWIDADEQSAEGKWKVVSESLTGYWFETTDIRYPTIEPMPTLNVNARNTNRDFKLDLSGFQVRLGIAFKL